jgi:hypothetical protein
MTLGRTHIAGGMHKACAGTDEGLLPQAGAPHRVSEKQECSSLYAYFQVCREGGAVVVTVQPPLGGPVLEAHDRPGLELVALCTLHTVRAMHTL